MGFLIIGAFLLAFDWISDYFSTVFSVSLILEIGCLTVIFGSSFN